MTAPSPGVSHRSGEQGVWRLHGDNFRNLRDVELCGHPRQSSSYGGSRSKDVAVGSRGRQPRLRCFPATDPRNALHRSATPWPRHLFLPRSRLPRRSCCLPQANGFPHQFLPLRSPHSRSRLDRSVIVFRNNQASHAITPSILSLATNSATSATLIPAARLRGFVDSERFQTRRNIDA